jgi:hypothetical protein
LCRHSVGDTATLLAVPGGAAAAAPEEASWLLDLLGELTGVMAIVRKPMNRAVAAAVILLVLAILLVPIVLAGGFGIYW